MRGPPRACCPGKLLTQQSLPSHAAALSAEAMPAQHIQARLTLHHDAPRNEVSKVGYRRPRPWGSFLCLEKKDWQEGAHPRPSRHCPASAHCGCARIEAVALTLPLARGLTKAAGI